MKACTGGVLEGVLCVCLLAFWAFVSTSGSGDSERSPPSFLFRARKNGQGNATASTTASDGQTYVPSRTPCTADELLPSLDDDLRDRWSPLRPNATRSREYNCTCPYTKASYFCANGRTDYPVWVPQAVADGTCATVAGDVLSEHPFPPGSWILFYGNSHLRQAMEGIMCQYSSMVVRREVLKAAENDRTKREAVTVPPLMHCRGCMTDWASTLTSFGCLPKAESHQATRCNDDRAVFELEDGTVIHFWFADTEGDKSVDDAFGAFQTSAEQYDCVIANVGNEPQMSVESAVRAAQEFHAVGASFLWLTTYDGQGDIKHWNSEDRKRFQDVGGRHIPVQAMMESMVDFTRGVAEGIEDDHFCLPGPPNELGWLILRLIWALYYERRAS